MNYVSISNTSQLIKSEYIRKSPINNKILKNTLVNELQKINVPNIDKFVDKFIESVTNNRNTKTLFKLKKKYI